MLGTRWEYVIFNRKYETSEISFSRLFFSCSRSNSYRVQWLKSMLPLCEHGKHSWSPRCFYQCLIFHITCSLYFRLFSSSFADFPVLSAWFIAIFRPLSISLFLFFVLLLFLPLTILVFWFTFYHRIFSHIKTLPITSLKGFCRRIFMMRRAQWWKFAHHQQTQKR